jgi:hypothetical protein
MRNVSRAAFHIAEGRIAAIASGVEVREGTAMARYFAFFFVGCAFSVGAVAMVESHHQVSNAMPQVVAFQGTH